ncbi:MAG: GntR family transcriptional regulator [Pseudomonadota bacterium]
MAKTRTGKGPRYREIANGICEAIAEGRLTVGSKLPGEHELRQRYKVSRHTIREALRMLEDGGFIQRHKGIGTVVTSDVARSGYVQRMQSVSELLQYPADTVLEHVGSANLVASVELAKTLGIPPRSHWSCLSAIRRDSRSGLALCWTDVYVLRRYRSVEKYIGTDPRPLYDVIEQVFGERIRSVEVELTAELLASSHAEALGVPEGQPAMNILRRYHGKDRVFEVSVVRHPSERFKYSLTMQRDWSTGS